MSELKTRYITDTYLDYFNSGKHDLAQIYLKSEADKVLAEKDKEIAELKEQVSEERSAKVDYKISANDLSNGLKEAYEEIKRHKYKRCIDMAKWCKSEEGRLEAIAPLFGTDKECWEYNSDYWVKWRERWLKIAEEFKGSV